jgi:5-methylcytosine-specific restriction endonuclease McrA
MSISARFAAQKKQDKIDKAVRAERKKREAEEEAVARAYGSFRLDETAKNSQLLEQSRASNQQRRTLLAATGGEYTPEQWQEVVARYGGVCLCCGADEDLTVDHVRPVILGGSSDISNLQPLCKSCNSRKGGQYIDYRPDRKT